MPENETPQMWTNLIKQACDGDRHTYEADLFHTERDTARAMLILTPAGEVTL